MSSIQSPGSHLGPLAGRTFAVAAIDGSPVLDGTHPELSFGADGVVLLRESGGEKP